MLVESEVAPSVGAWQAQELDVAVACQRPVQVRVSQHTQKPGFGYFTVLDDIGVGGEACTSESPYQPTHL